ncbi:hypothetical protein SCARD494_01892 [Seiridium cardinale]
MNGTNGHSNSDGSVSASANFVLDPVIRGLAKTETTMPIAIIGMACRFGGEATSPSKLWDLCAAGKDGWSLIPKDRFDVQSLYHTDKTRVGRSHVMGGYFMDRDVALFDAAFFNLASDVASGLDPQCRLLLETVYEATEDAGIPIEKLAGSNTSMYTGTFNKDYHEIQTKDAEVLPQSFLAGTGTAMLSNRISHFFDLQGPSMSIDTGCSAGLVAMHQGCQSIRLGESDVSIVGAASTLLSQDAFISASTIGAIGAEGKCYSWDTRASGYGRGEGVASLILKSVNAALRDGDNIHAIIKDTVLNQDGKTTTITSPSADAQARLIQDSYRRAGLDIAETGYVEAHMTGTSAGDPIEAEAIGRTFGSSRKADDPILVGSVKTNIGHTEPVSGLAAVIKTTFALKNALIPPNLNYKEANPEIHLSEWHLQVPTTLTPWPKNKPLRASINNFGYGGTNGHAILEPAPTVVVTRPIAQVEGLHNGIDEQESQRRIYVLSAKDSTACQSMMRRLADHIINTPPLPSDLAYTLSERRSLHSWITAIPANSIGELVERLQEPVSKPFHAYKRPRLGFVFNGQGAQWHAMGRELIAAYPVFGDAIRKASEILRHYGASWSIQEELMRDAASSRVSEAHLSQPISVAIQLGLVDLLTSWSIVPSAVTSHSSGEIAAAYAVGLLTFEEALGVAYYRGEIARKHLKLSSVSGGMLAVGIHPEGAKSYLADRFDGKVVIACINSPSSVTLSGDVDALDEVVSCMEKDGIFARRLKVPMAYHSHHMVPMAEEYTTRLNELLSGVDRKVEGRPAFASPVTGDLITTSKLPAEHWVQNMTSPVRFKEAFESICFGSADDGSKGLDLDLIVEIGAHATLAGPIRQILQSRNVDLPYAACLRRQFDAVETMQDLACEILSRGYPVSLKSVNFPHGSQHCTFVSNLPTYPWNHTKRYWVEPRVSKDQRFKKFPPHELLGTILNGTNSLMPTWRNILRLREVEWLRDHQIDGTTVFPGAGYIASAIEAVRLLIDPTEETIRNYRMRDIDFMQALVIPDTAFGVETQFSLSPCSEKEFDHQGWYEFRLCSSVPSSNQWIEHCKGYVLAETGDAINVATTRLAKPPTECTFFGQDSDVTHVGIEKLFSGLRERGIYHGPIFQNLTDSCTVGERAITNFKISDIACAEHNYLLHPTTLDSILQSSFSSLPNDMDKETMVLPRSICSLFVPKTLERHGGSELRAFTERVKSDKHGHTSNIVITGTNDPEGNLTTTSFMEVRDFFGQIVPRRKDVNFEQDQGICSRVCWELDVLSKVPDDIRTSMIVPIRDEEVETERKLARTSYYFFQAAISELQGENDELWEWYHKRMYTWMEMIVALGKEGKLGPGSQAWSKATPGVRKMLIDELRAANAAGRLTVRVGENLAKIIRGEVMPLELMMEGGLLDDFYMNHEALKTRSYSHLSKISELYALKNPGANVLEIGGGTGGATRTVIEGFATRGDGSGTILGHYTFTDISPGFFDAAKEKFSVWADMMSFKKLDIEVDPSLQGFKPGSYDLIVAASVLHATKSLTRTLNHVRQLLKPGGKLLLIEATADRLEGQLIFGTLPGWWLGEEPERQSSPNAPLEMWDRVLRETGFTGVDFEISDYEEPEYQSARVMLSSASTTLIKPVSILLPSKTDVMNPQLQHWLSELGEAVQQLTGTATPVENLNDFTPQPDTIYIFIAEMESPFVDGMDAEAFDQLKKVLVNCFDVLWLSCGGLVDATDPSFAATDGVLRTLRQEDSNKRCIRLDFELDNSPWTLDKIDHIIHVMRQSFDHRVETADMEWEYYVKDSLRHVPRAYPDRALDASAWKLKLNPKPELQPFKQEGRPLIWETPTSGVMELNPYFVYNEEINTTAVPSGMVEVEAKAFGLNFREVMVQLGQLEEPLKGHECSGIITKLGPDTGKSNLKIGDRVCALVKGRIATKGRTHWTSVVKLPDDMKITWEEAASIPAAYATAYSCLVTIGRLQRGESVLVHAATGATGQAAVVIAKHIGARVLATCSSEEKRDLLIQKYGIDPKCIFSSRETSFVSGIASATGGRGVDVVLNSLSGPLLKASWECVARFGRFVDISKVDMEAGRRLDTGPFKKCASYTGFDLIQFTEYNGSLTQDALVQSVQICKENGNTAMYPITPFSISDMAKAMRLMQGGTHMGKLVLVPHEGDQVPVVTRPSPVSLDCPDASYLIAGGLTGIGQAIARWMIQKGAKNLILVSRHATSHAATAAEIKEDARLAGCRVIIQDCDVADENDLLRLLERCYQTLSLPPIRGVVNGAMVLDDTVLERMSFVQWLRAVRPKIDSSRNLHKHLKDVAFFIMLSSVAGVVGHMSQANYAAGNTFQDALARSRTRRAQPAVAIDLGAVGSVGYVAQMEASGDDRLRTRVDNLGFGSVDIEQVLALVEAAIQSPLRVSPDDSQIIVGSYLNASSSQTAMLNDKRLGTLRIASKRGSQDTSTSASNSTALVASLVQTLSWPSTTPEEATALLTEALAAKTADIFSLPLADIDPELPLSRYGVDSLVAVELRNWLGTTVKAKVSVFDILQSPSMSDFAGLVVGKSEYMTSKVAGNGTARNAQVENGKIETGEIHNGYMANGTSG